MAWEAPKPMELEQHGNYLTRVVGSFEDYAKEKMTMEHRVHEPRTETVGSAPKKRTLFDAIENPEPGWSTRRIEQIVSSDTPPVWRIELMHDESGAVFMQQNESLYVAWARATEAAHMHRIGLKDA